MNKQKRIAGAVSLILVMLACQNEEGTQNVRPIDDSPIFMEFPRSTSNGRMASEAKYAVFSAEYVTAQESGQVGRTIYFSNVGNKRLSADFVPGLSLDETDNVSFYVDQNRPSADLSVTQTSSAVVRAMQTWNGVVCSDLGMYEVPFNSAISTGFVSLLLGFGGSADYTADIVHAGWLPAAFFDAITPGGSALILGVTYTIIFTDDAGDPTDLDNNGKADVAWREIYYNDTFTWRIGNHYDVETIALHEAGHGLSQAHFGSAFSDSGSENLHFAPRAVMNAAYSGIQTSINETDNAGHCSNWANWNNN
ncbi:MAG TPA: hypothetical protein VF141_04845 [Chryseolinea sp.]